MRWGVILTLGLAFTGCDRAEPPTPRGSPSIAEPVFRPAPSSSAPGSASASATAASSSAAAPSASAGIDPSSLPQTHDRPVETGAAFESGVAALWDAIVADDPARAMPFFFPLGAYRQVKDIPDPASDWNRRLVAAYTRDIHALHARLGEGASRAQRLAFEVPAEHARWVDPGEEYNKIGYYRVFGSRFRYSIDDAAHTIDVKSLISWRGEWYVVHLSAIH